MKPYLSTWDVYSQLPEADKRSIYDAPGVAVWFDRLFEMAVYTTPRTKRLTGYYLLELKAKDEAA